MLAWTNTIEVLLGLSKSPGESIKQALELAQKAAELGEGQGFLHSLMGRIYRVQGKFDKAIAEGKQAVTLRPNDARPHIFLAGNLYYGGRPEEAIIHARKAMRLEPYYPAWFLISLGGAYEMAGRYEEAIATSKQLYESSLKGEYPPINAHVVLARNYARLDRMEDARAHVAAILKIKPDYSVEFFRKRNLWKDRAYHEGLVDLLIKAGLPEHPPLELPDKPSIAVLPFNNMSDDPAQEYFSDGLSEEIITALSKVPKLFVIARNSSFTYKGKPVKVQQVGRELGVKYVLEGSVRKAGNRVRITAQLIDAANGRHLWAERYDRELKDIFALQDEITKKILSSLQIKLTEGEIARWFEKGTNSLEAYLVVLKGREFFYRQDREGNSIAQSLFQEAIAHDPNYAIAYSYLARTHNMDMWFGSSKSPGESLKQALKFAKKAIALDENLADAHSILGYIYTLMRQHDQAIAEGKKAVELAPNSDSAKYMYGISLNYFGRRNEAIRLMERAIRLNPMPPGIYYHHLGTAYYHSGRYEEAIAAFNKTLQLSPNHQWANLGLAATYGLMDREDEARAVAAEALRINPQFTIEGLAKKLPYKNPEDIDRTVKAFRKAGLK
jgi:TolB-like protein/Flp pilus assembly protein TadD